MTLSPHQIAPKWWLLIAFVLFLSAIYLSGCNKKLAPVSDSTAATDTAFVQATTISQVTGLELAPGQVITVGDITITSIGNGQAVVEQTLPVVTRTETVAIPTRNKTVIRNSGNNTSKEVDRSDNSITDKSKEVYKTSDDSKVIDKSKEVTKTKDLDKTVTRGFPWWIVLVVVAIAGALWYLKEKLSLF